MVLEQRDALTPVRTTMNLRWIKDPTEPQPLEQDVGDCLHDLGEISQDTISSSPKRKISWIILISSKGRSPPATDTVNFHSPRCIVPSSTRPHGSPPANNGKPDQTRQTTVSGHRTAVLRRQPREAWLSARRRPASAPRGTPQTAAPPGGGPLRAQPWVGSGPWVERRSDLSIGAASRAGLPLSGGSTLKVGRKVWSVGVPSPRRAEARRLQTSASLLPGGRCSPGRLRRAALLFSAVTSAAAH